VAFAAKTATTPMIAAPANAISIVAGLGSLI
jgi:hypothetical protein